MENMKCNCWSPARNEGTKNYVLRDNINILSLCFK